MKPAVQTDYIMIQQQNKTGKKNQPITNKSVWDYFTSSPYVYLIIFLFIFIIYRQVLSFFLGKLDEADIILANINILKDFGNLKDVFSTDAFFSAKNATFYRPMQNISFMIDAHLSGSAAWGYYLSNMIIHAVTCSSIFYLLNLIYIKKGAALLSALFFAASPLFVHAIAWAPSRGDLLIGMFGILSLIFFIRYLRSKNFNFLIYNLITVLLAVFSKETAILLPALFLFYCYFMEDDRKVTNSGLIVPFLSYGVIIAFYLFLRNLIVLNSAPTHVFGILPLLNNLRTIPEFISKFILPIGLSPMAGFDWVITISGMIMIIVITGLVVKFHSGSTRWIYFGTFWFLLFTLPGMMYTHPLGNAAYDYLEHRSYLPLIGVLIILCSLIIQLEKSQKFRNLYIYLFLVCVIFGTYSFIYAGNYANPITFYNRAIEANPNSAMAHYNRGEVYAFREKNYQHAMEDFDKALKIKPDYSKAFVNRGICKEFLGDTIAALKDCETSAKLDPGLFIAHKNIAIIKNQLGLKTEAIQEWDLALKISPDYYQGFNERGLIKLQLEDFPSAEKDFTRCLEINEKYPEAYLNRGLLFYTKKDLNKACKDWKSAADLGSEPAVNLLHEYCEK